MSTNSSVTSFGDISVCEDIGELTEKCKDLHEHICKSHETLEIVHKLIISRMNINVNYMGWTGDFETVLEKFHEESLEDIKNGRPTNFGKKLLSALNTTLYFL